MSTSKEYLSLGRGRCCSRECPGVHRKHSSLHQRISPMSILQYKISLLQPVIAQLPPLSNSDCKLLLSSHLGPLYVCQRTITSLCVNFSGNKKTISPVISVSSVQRCHLPRIQARQTLTLPVIHISYLNGYHQ